MRPLRIATGLAVLALSAWAGMARAAPTLVWQQGKRTLSVACDDHGGRAVFRLSDGTHPVQTMFNGGYCDFVTVIWRGPQAPDAPAALVAIANGGSDGEVDFIAATFDPAPRLQAISDDHGDARNHAPVLSGQFFRFDFSLFVTAPFGASNANSVTAPVAMTWRNGTFAIDTPALASRVFAPMDLAFRENVIRREVEAWLSRDDWQLVGLPLTTKALLDLIASGHADQAHLLLDHALDHVAFDREAYWNDLAAIVVQNASLTPALKGHLPEWGVLSAAAAKSDPKREAGAYRLRKTP